MKAGRYIATARASLQSQRCPGPRFQVRGPLTEESNPWPPHSSSGSASTSPTRATPKASSADHRPPRLLDHAAPAYSSCRCCGPSAASGSPRGGRCPPRTVPSQQAKRLAVPSADVPGSHVHTFLAVPHRELPLMLVRPLVHANGVHRPVSPPSLSTPTVPPSSASTLTQPFHPRCHVSRLER